MGKMIKMKTSLFSTGCTARYRYKGKTYIVQSSFMPPTAAVSNDGSPYRLKNIFENALTRDPQLTDPVTVDTICSNVECLSAGKEQ